MARTQEPSGIASEAELAHAADQPPTREWREDPKAGPPRKSDVDAVKLKQAADPATDSLKLKAASEGLGSGQGAAALKEKLAARFNEDAALALKASGLADAARPRLAHEKRKTALRPVPSPGETEREAPAVSARIRGTACEVRRWRGYVTSTFCAVATDTDGTERTIGRSPSFRWWRSDLPETPDAAAALRALVKSLQWDGWRVEGTGDEWFALRLRRTADHIGTGQTKP